MPCRHHSVRGVQLWAASRMVELTFKRFMMMCSGTWAMNHYLRALGAKIGAWSTVRLGLCLPLLPDSIELGSGCAAHPALLHSWAVQQHAAWDFSLAGPALAFQVVACVHTWQCQAPKHGLWSQHESL